MPLPQVHGFRHRLLLRFAFETLQFEHELSLLRSPPFAAVIALHHDVVILCALHPTVSIPLLHQETHHTVFEARVLDRDGLVRALACGLLDYGPPAGERDVEFVPRLYELS
jgi:hypothetical protein